MIDIFGRKVKELQKEVTELKEKLTECSDKLSEKQEQINKTNAYWKKKLWEAKEQGVKPAKVDKPKPGKKKL